MNTKNINSAIAIMTRHMEARLPLDTSVWQNYKGAAKIAFTKEEELCGTPCCFAGYIAVSPEFRKDGGTCRTNGCPELAEFYDEHAIREWVGCNIYQAESLCAVGRTKLAYPYVAFGGNVEFPDVIAALTSLRDTGKLPGE